MKAICIKNYEAFKKLKIYECKRYFITSGGEYFGWLLFRDSNGQDYRILSKNSDFYNYFIVIPEQR